MGNTGLHSDSRFLFCKTIKLLSFNRIDLLDDPRFWKLQFAYLIVLPLVAFICWMGILWPLWISATQTVSPVVWMAYIAGAVVLFVVVRFTMPAVKTIIGLLAKLGES